VGGGTITLPDTGGSITMSAAVANNQTMHHRIG
jgi:hypothetical protein